MKWDERFLRLAQEVAGYSKDPDRQVGCIIVAPDRRQFTMGYNGFPRGVADSHERMHDRDLKNQLMVHAELNAILNARIDLTEWTLYTTRPPCSGCALAIIQAGISCVICQASNPPSSRWYLSQRQARDLILEAGVKYQVYNPPVTAIMV